MSEILDLSLLSKGSVLLIRFDAEKYPLIVNQILKETINERGLGCVWICYSRPHEAVEEQFSIEESKRVNLKYVDCISEMSIGKVEASEERVHFVENPSSLEEVNLYVEKLLKTFGGERLLVLDSISDILVHNHIENVKEFVHVLVNKVRLEGLHGILLDFEGDKGSEMDEFLIPTCDHVLNLTDNKGSGEKGEKSGLGDRSDSFKKNWDTFLKI